MAEQQRSAGPPADAADHGQQRRPERRGPHTVLSPAGTLPNHQRGHHHHSICPSTVSCTHLLMCGRQHALLQEAYLPCGLGLAQRASLSILCVQEVCLEQPFTAQLRVHNASSAPADSLALSLPAEEIPGFGMHLMVGPLTASMHMQIQEGLGQSDLGCSELLYSDMTVCNPYTLCSVCQWPSMQGVPGEVLGELSPTQNQMVQCGFLPLHGGLVRFPLLQLMSSTSGKILDVLAEDTYVTAGGV